jgi:serine protease AprX
MRHKRLPWLISLLLIVALIVPGLVAAQPAQTQNQPAIRLAVGSFTPGVDESPEQALAIPAELALREVPAGTSGYYIVQFHGPVTTAWRAELERTGAAVLDYLPDFAYKVRMSPDTARDVQRLPEVNWVGIFQPAYKLSPSLQRAGTRFYRVVVEQGGDAASVAASLEGLGVHVMEHSGQALNILAESTSLAAVANVLDVAWVENLPLKETHNEYGAGVIMGANTANSSGYDGSTQTVAVADTGLGTGVAATAFADIPASRITNLYNWEGADDPTCYTVDGDGPRDVDSGHGTHTAGSVLSGGRPNGTGKGTAPAAHLVFQAVEDYVEFVGLCSLFYANGYYLFGIPADLHALYQQAYNAGARIHSNSWGSSAASAYTDDSAATDDFIYQHPDMTITFSAGNEGTDGNADGIVDSGSLGSPATAKNVITVGASENNRQGHYGCDGGLTYTDCALQGGQNEIPTYGVSWPFDYPVDPLASDPEAGNANQMAAFSSRGPVQDGRIKPDVVAPGTWVLSAYSDLFQQGYDGSPNPQDSSYQDDGWGFPQSQYYKYMGGTSMSNPLVAGAAAVVRDYYQKEYGKNASAALVKATLINSAVDLLDENNDGVNDNDFPIPNIHEGWGRVNVANATDGSALFVDATNGVNTGGSVTYQYEVSSSSNPLKISLVWTDYPSTSVAASNLVNDLDLVVTSPTGSTYRGNVFSGGWSQAGGSADRVNNVENVYVHTPGPGMWTVSINGFNVPHGPQNYALVVDGAGAQEPSSQSRVLIPLAMRQSSSGAGINNEDILQFDPASGSFQLYFDGSDVGLSTDLESFALLPDGSLLLSLANSSDVPDLGNVAASETLRFIPDSLGSRTAGRFERYAARNGASSP